jgi:hypothetical protein
VMTLPSPLGILPFVAVKFIGYTLATPYLERQYATPVVSHGGARPSANAEPLVLPVLFGLARTVLGVASGIAVSDTGAVHLVLKEERRCEQPRS